MKLTLVEPPQSLPVTLEFARAHSRVLGDSEDELIEAYLAAATAELDGPTGVVGKCFMPQIWRLALVGWLGPVALRVEPVASVEVRYIDQDGVEQLLDPQCYVIDDDVSRSPQLIWRKALPPLGDDPWPVRIDITAGHAQQQPDVQVAIVLRAAQLYEQREATITGTIVAVNPAFDAIVSKLRRKL